MRMTDDDAVLGFDTETQKGDTIRTGVIMNANPDVMGQLSSPHTNHSEKL
jgi:hypothetical protein